MIDVVAAVIVRDQKYLVAQRPDSKGGQWEFPGGKVESEETMAYALTREIQEELGVRILVGDCLNRFSTQVLGQTYLVHFFAASLLTDTFKLFEHQAIQWASSTELLKLAMSSADSEFVKHINTK